MDSLDRIRSRAEGRRHGEYRSYEHVRPGMCFIQGDQNIANQAGAGFRSDLNNELQALVTFSQGNSAPGTTYRNMTWHDTTNNVKKRRNAANAAWIVEGTLDESFVLSRATNTILGLSDFGKTIIATAGFTQTLTAAATLGDGWYVYIRNDGTGVITIDPNSSETIDGTTTIELLPGSGIVVACNGSAFKTLGRGETRVGQFVEYAGTGVPTGYLACDGSAVSRTTYAALFAEISTTWGVGDGSTTFNVPDLRRRTTVGSGGSGTGTLGNAVGNVGGEEGHALTGAESGPHTHGPGTGDRFVTLSAGADGAQVQVVAGGDAVQGSSGTAGGSTSSSGSGTAHNTIQPSAVVRKAIRY